ncbi:hypothetical protein BDW02DRAFT_646074 [Decorospora gaudefroyi]|uniref:RING-type domain-containing protein n=1 Tax=Decorospora gaudefroyi TaxID=184978 RepID=A0A6A5KLS1_9PLEO|nr:hypothetical protein BDW02DRAFT_646074 [Decorospora gaudefroyi]
MAPLYPTRETFSTTALYPTAPAPPQSRNTTCPICIEPLDTTTTQRLPTCSHVFCGPCIESWFDEAGTCPVCREEIFPSSPAEISLEMQRLPYLCGRIVRLLDEVKRVYPQGRMLIGGMEEGLMDLGEAFLRDVEGRRACRRGRERMGMGGGDDRDGDGDEEEGNGEEGEESEKERGQHEREEEEEEQTQHSQQQSQTELESESLLSRLSDTQPTLEGLVPTGPQSDTNRRPSFHIIPEYLARQDATGPRQRSLLVGHPAVAAVVEAFGLRRYVQDGDMGVLEMCRRGNAWMRLKTERETETIEREVKGCGKRLGVWRKKMFGR